MKNLLLLSALLLGTYSASANALECGDSIEVDTVMEADLDCSSYSGFAALEIKGDAVLNAKGHSINTPNTSVGIYAEGGLIKIKNLDLSGAPGAIGIMGYNVRKLVVNKTTARDMFIGVDYYTSDDYDCDRVRVSNSDLSDNDYAVRVNSPNCDYTPRFVNSNFSNSKEYALYLTAKKIRINGLLDNDFTGSSNGLLLQSFEKTVIVNLDLSNSDIQGTQVFAYESPLVKIKDSQFGNNAGEGVHLYDINKVIMRRVSSINSGVGIKIANDRVGTEFKGRKITTNGNDIAGLILSSSNDIKFSSIDLPEESNSILDFLLIDNQ